MKFKEGDKVKFVELKVCHEKEQFNIGDVLKVVFVDDDYMPYCCENKKGEREWFTEEELELWDENLEVRVKN